MAWYSILPPQLIQFESWAVRIFFLLGLITIVPWFAMLVFDAGLYLYRMILWEFPWVGGRARGHQRPRAPSLQERPDGQRRAFGLKGVQSDSGDSSRECVSASKNSAEKENVAPATEGPAHPSTDGDVKRRTSGRA
ncbi:hypothetical protein N7532_004123 [Penicillium argentinense]|uniref:Uncharacterized protein n=1 Tax=Penicillium argentinense TaxID=1131581 RepID=A0A9W9FNW1_9EURO|nr:uncharacterized protein N7532_004123 [Penicillium argentinense]KAJ5103594.1 hypothetical protein N7532_004123 [Penicillium argentinense]